MKTTHYFFLLFLFALPCFLAAQAHVGSWSMSGVTPEGQSVTNVVTFMADGKMTVDFGGDGTVEVHATYTNDGGVISVSDTSADSPCYGKVGKYRVAVSGNTLTATLVSDSCDARKGDGSPMVMTRK